MRKWTHPQGLAALVVGIYAVLSPIWTTTPTGSKATNTMITLGVITAAVALFSLARPDRIAFEGLIALMGVLFVLSPWVMGFTGFTSLSWTAWIVGIVALLAGAADVQMTRSAHRGGGMVTNH
jgi:SPW repeat